MFWLGLLLVICFVPGYMGASVPTQWALLSAILPAFLWLPGPYTEGHRLFLLTLAYGALSVLWAINPYSWVLGFWWLGIWALAYHFGTRFHSLRGIWIGVAVGIGLSDLFVLAQLAGYHPVEAHDSAPYAGIFFNSALAGVIAGLTIVGLVCHRLWGLVPLPALALVASGSRGGWALVAVGLAARYIGLWGIAGVIVAGAALFTLHTLGPSDLQRLELWGITANALRWQGWGLGGYKDVFYIRQFTTHLIWADNAHNDILQLAYELGLAALAPLAVFAMALTRTRSRNWPVLVAWTTAGLFFFPLYTPILAFLGCAMAGNCLRSWAVDGADLRRRRHDLLLWSLAERPIPSHPRGQVIPLGQRTTHTEP